MKNLLLLLLLPYICSSQKNDHNHNSIDFYYGYKFYKSNFYEQLNTIKSYNLSQPIKQVGIGISGYFSVERGTNYYGHLLYNQVVPITFHINDSISGKLTGFVVSHGGGGKIIHNNWLLINWYLGANAGRLRLYQNSLLKQKNPFFSPKLGLQTKIKMGRIALSGLIEYEYDISSSRWRKTPYYRGERIYVGGFRQSGLSVQVGVGFCME